MSPVRSMTCPGQRDSGVGAAARTPAILDLEGENADQEAGQHSGAQPDEKVPHAWDVRNKATTSPGACRGLVLDLSDSVRPPWCASNVGKLRAGGRRESYVIGKDPGSSVGECPSVYTTERDTVLVQGWRFTDVEALASMEVPEEETVVEIPRSLLPLLRQL
ncbi:hypothetical protein GCM10010124_19700 [Pilimelia terevasa]|uniref:Uncharacterized protein n=1 Tax=Pilimelia terevasa TaxID=53372 RepID=A0A8J3FH27_9ACTN|nr:hypothetical protein GCM10010124_19700 [Pilimelia terevasa]